MWAELSIQTKNKLPTDIVGKLEERMTKVVEKRKAIDATYFRFQYEFEDQFIFWHMSNKMVFLVSKPEAQMLKIHLENTMGNDNLKSLKFSINEVGERFTRFIKEMEIEIKEIKVQINVESDIFQRGIRMNFLSSTKKIFTDNSLLDFIIAIAIFLVSIIRGFNTCEAVINVLIGLILFIGWLGVSYLVSKDKFVYSEE